MMTDKSVSEKITSTAGFIDVTNHVRWLDDVLVHKFL